jgi:hypothetical protein
MISHILADALMLLHLLWVIFNVTGFFLALRWPILGKIHVTTLGISVLFALTLGYCPITQLEWKLRSSANPIQPEQGGFISNYIEKLIYVRVSDNVIFYITFGLLLLSMYLHLFRSRKNNHIVQ